MWFPAKATWSGNGKHEKEETLYRTLPPQQGCKSQGWDQPNVWGLSASSCSSFHTLQGLPGFLWKHPKQEAKERKEKESADKEKKERLEKLEKKKASETVETGKEMSTSKNWISWLNQDEEHFNSRILCLTVLLEISPIKRTQIKNIWLDSPRYNVSPFDAEELITLTGH